MQERDTDCHYKECPFNKHLRFTDTRKTSSYLFWDGKGDLPTEPPVRGSCYACRLWRRLTDKDKLEKRTARETALLEATDLDGALHYYCNEEWELFAQFENTLRKKVGIRLHQKEVDAGKYQVIGPQNCI